MNILIVEDEFIIKEYLKRVVGRIGLNIVGESANGKLAVALARDREPDLIFMDIRLEGELNGFEAAKEICQRKPVPIVFMSAYDYKDEIEQNDWPCKAVFFNKPVDEACIRDFLAKLN